MLRGIVVNGLLRQSLCSFLAMTCFIKQPTLSRPLRFVLFLRSWRLPSGGRPWRVLFWAGNPKTSDVIASRVLGFCGAAIR